VGWWILALPHAQFVIPERTIILAGESLRFIPEVTGLRGSVSPSLLLPNGSLATTASPGVAVLPDSRQEKTFTPSPPSPPAAAHESAEDLSVAAKVPAVASSTMPVWGSAAGLGALLAVGIAATLYVRRKSDAPDPGEEFEIES
jgi:hypothetical protein